MRLACFRDSILRSDEVVKPLGLQVSELLLSTDEATFDDTVNAFVSLTAIQVSPWGRGRVQRPGAGRGGCRGRGLDLPGPPQDSGDMSAPRSPS